ncbi:FMN reductase [Bradyrhizobium sp. INPA01-394B]|uniref:FMN reductase (NADH) RutF n=1 Tax=Bradyrhizobium campsiandrae TaxID=1729892 RepID=A0ABR7U7Q8_9BRAD|nr:flavin reductase [Bradyrhizobium campsiandrae]MBC9881688.1 FMN reductase [Bradyrhizobium campsiandrae]MBC9980020.1 flavin reductase [Bradyrhizobium campsiandrae]
MQDIAPQDYRDAMACLGAAVSIVTTDGGAGRAGFSASAICSVTDDPPTLLVCINRASSAYAGVTGNKVVCVNVLSARHEPLSRLFGGKVPADERFAAAAWSTLETGAPVLADGAAAFDCRIASVVNVGTHDVLFCRVVALQRSGCLDNLIYFGRAYHTVGVTTRAEAGSDLAHGRS